MERIRIAHDIGFLELQIRDVIKKAQQDPDKFREKNEHSVLYYQGGALKGTVAVSVDDKDAFHFTYDDVFAAFAATDQQDSKISNLFKRLDSEKLSLTTPVASVGLASARMFGHAREKPEVQPPVPKAGPKQS